MSSINLKCPVPGCTYETGTASEAVVVALLTAHTTTHSVSRPTHHGAKLERPHIELGVSAEEWRLFERRWALYVRSANIQPDDASSQLFQCASEQLGDAVLRLDHQVIEKPADELLKTMKSLAVIPVATMVLRTELFAMRQRREETFRNFLARVRGKAETCSYSSSYKCQCGKSNTVDFTETISRDVVIAGIYDEDIRRRVMSVADLCNKTTNSIVTLVETEEMARDSIPAAATTTAISDYRNSGSSDNISPARKTKIPCPQCKQEFYPFKRGKYGWNKKPHATCTECFQKTNSKAQTNKSHTISAMTSQTGSVSANMSSFAKVNKRTRHQPRPCDSAPFPLTHHIFTEGQWKRARFTEHPTVQLTLSVNSEHYTAFGLECPNTSTKQVCCVADSGAQSNLWSLKDCLGMGFTTDDLIPVNVTLSAANQSGIQISGAILVQMNGMKNSNPVTCSAMVYISPSVSGFYLCQQTMMDLGILPLNFPSVGEAFLSASQHAIHDRPPTTESNGQCSCPPRKAVPPRPTKLPFACTPENVESMRKWLLEYFASSTFNTCPHQPLPSMTGPPIEMHLDSTAVPRVCHTPATVPIHWQEKVKSDLERDVALGVIEKVPYGDPVSWCHRMVVTRKHDGTPRRTVDLSPLNKHCKRETFAMESPFHLARKIPGNTWKTVTDAWNGYHSVPLCESDRHLTTFITPFGRYRYKRAPQGFVSSGDGYNRRFDAVLSDFVRKERCVDDTAHYDEDIEQHWWRTIELLEVVGRAGIILNPDKFQFCQKSVEFAGFRVNESSIEPLPKYLDAIRDFPTPKNITDVRSWFGLVNQVANYAQLRTVMAPFRELLSPKNTFQWTPELDLAFITSKDAIVQAIMKGVEIFDLSKKTCLRPDWSKQGIGYFLLQKHCLCESNLPNCCSNGWRIVLAGSRFLSSAEQRYAPIEGEALAVAWGLEQSKYFTQGCEELLVVTDHKPLVKILGDRTLDEISNSRLFRLKQRTLPWRFSIAHLPGKTNSAADATSRNPSPRINDYSDEASNSLLTYNDTSEISHNASISEDVSSTFSLSWADLKTATASDATLHRLSYLVEAGFPEIRSELPVDIIPYWNFKEALYIQDGVIMYNDRVVVPKSLRRSIVVVLHSAHQGVSMMESRARSIVFWPGMSQDIQRIRDACMDCCRNAPSQAATPAFESSIPSTPFECIVADYFESHGHNFLVVADRLSGWVEIFSSPSGSFQASATGLIANLRTFFSIYGVPEELASDGGPQFKAQVTEEFLSKWGVRHRVSSSYFPQSNGRAEVAVKTAKRLLLSNIGANGSINNDKFLRAILQLRNTPDPDCKISPAEIVFGRQLRDAFSFTNRIQKFKNPNIQPMWREAWRYKEHALRTRFTRNMERLNDNTRRLPPLQPGDKVFIQNQTGNHPNKWDKSGTVMETREHDQYVIKVDGSGRVTIRNRRFLRRFTPASPIISRASPQAVRLQDADHLTDVLVDQPTDILIDQPADFLMDQPTDILMDQATDMPDIVAPVGPLHPLQPDSLPNPDDSTQQTSSQPAERSQRPRRVVKPRQMYDAASGKWVDLN